MIFAPKRGNKNFETFITFDSGRLLGLVAKRNIGLSCQIFGVPSLDIQSHRFLKAAGGKPLCSARDTTNPSARWIFSEKDRAFAGIPVAFSIAG